MLCTILYNYLMTQVISTQTKTFKFTDELSSETTSYYLTTVTVKELKYENGSHYWDIGYVNKFIPGPNESPESIAKLKKITHPFFGSNVKDFMDYEGDIILKNPMTSFMVEYLLADYEQLSLVSGFTTPQRYKQSIMWSLSYFWD